MKAKSVLNFMLLPALWVTAINVQAANTVQFNGEITDSTCSAVAGDSGVVTLPTMSTSDFSGQTTTGRTAFAIQLTGCTGTLQNVGAQFIVDPINVDMATDLIRNTGTATGVNVRLRNKDSNINYVGLSQLPIQYVDVSSGSGTLNYFAEYFSSSGTVKPGTVRGQLEYVLSYQ
ncbi:fimbrial protein [Shewanella mangrovisoli]|uniref:fimbrial protein n=1 Tax=Shewanella mangrovisoli TaxID=2864211 RepID=UPI0035BB7E97